MPEVYFPDDTLMHYGVKGMRWGKRKAAKSLQRDVKKYEKAQSLKQIAKDTHKTVPTGNSVGKIRTMNKALKYDRQADKILSKLGPQKINDVKKELDRRSEQDKRNLQKTLDRVDDFLAKSFDKNGNPTKFWTDRYGSEMND